MAVGAGSIKRASKLNTEAETKKTVAADVAAENVPADQAAEVVAENVPVKEATEKKAPAKKTTTKKTTAKKTAEAKTAETKPAAKKTTTKKVETSVITNIDPVVLDGVLGKKEKKNQACHLTEDMPIYLL